MMTVKMKEVCAFFGLEFGKIYIHVNCGTSGKRDWKKTVFTYLGREESSVGPTGGKVYRVKTTEGPLEINFQDQVFRFNNEE
jgi:hypothetical protein